MSSTVTMLRTETLRKVLPARSLNNVYSGTTIPQNPRLATNSFSNAHADSYQSETVRLLGPTSGNLRLIIQHNPYGFAANMTCNERNQMIALSVLGNEFYLVVFDSECKIISSTYTGQGSGTLAGGYFFLNSDNNAVVVSGAGNTLACYPTANVRVKNSVYSLDFLWKTVDLVNLITGSSTGNSFFMAMPIWKSKPNLYWAVLNGMYDFQAGTLNSNSFVAVIEIVPDGSQQNGCRTTLIDSIELRNQWCNNPPAVSEEAVFVVTNACDKTGACTSGFMHSIGFDARTQKIKFNWSKPYQNSGHFLPGMKNIGSGTAPTLFQDENGVEYVTIGDNAYPRMHVVVYKLSDGTKVSETPLFAKMRSCDEASLIAAHGRVIAENNFGHTNPDFQTPQLVSNEPGLALVKVKSAPGETSEVIWENDHVCCFGMSMLARESGIIYAHTGDWSVPDSSTKGALYSMSAIDAWDGREIWRIPLGQGNTYCHEYGGTYFDRDGNLFVGTQQYLVSIQNHEDN